MQFVPVAQGKNTRSAAGASRPALYIHACADRTYSIRQDPHANATPKRTKKSFTHYLPGRQRLIAKITNICYKHELNIVQNNEFVDHRTGRFFMRTELEGIFNDTTLLADLDGALPEGSVRELHSTGRRRIVVLVTKEAHCLGDLLMKSAYGGLDVEIAAVIGNHDTLQTLVERFDIPFHLVSHEGLTREQHDREMTAKIDQYQPDYVVLAKYMRVLTPAFVQHYPNQVINIHHSFLPAFIGARPYHQAYERGVKIIGATAHYVNDNLDEGPIIMQD